MDKFVTLEELPKHLHSIPRKSWKRLFTLITEICSASTFVELKDIGRSSYYLNSDLVDRFLKMVYEMGLIVDFPWMQWEEGIDLVQNKETVYQNFQPLMLVKLLTIIVRADRFYDGTLVEAFESGKILQILQGLEKHYGVDIK
jgi:hypothetical protein